MKKLLIPTIITAVLIVGAVWALRAEKQAAVPPVLGDLGLVFYYGDGCPHCANVEKYFSDNQVESKIKFEKKEVYNNDANREELLKRAEACGLDKASVGIPLLWHDGQCLNGDTPIIDFFKAELKTK